MLKYQKYNYKLIKKYKNMRSYINLLKDILENGIKKDDRTGTGNISVFGRMIRHNMQNGFPLLTTKKMFFKGIKTELLWFLRGETNIKFLIDNNCYIWVGDCYKNYNNKNPNNNLSKMEFIEKLKDNRDFCKKWGELGPIYGKQWRNWGGIDQIENVINTLLTNPDNRRILVNAWNVDEIDKALLPPCHYGFQLYTIKMNSKERIEFFEKYNENIDISKLSAKEVFEKYDVPERKISLKFDMRSIDTPLGLPFNIASYALLLEIIAKKVNMIPNELIAFLGDTHIYLNQIDGVKQQIKRQPLKLPEIQISNKRIDDISEYNIDDIQLVNYKSHEKIEFPLSN